MKQPEYNKDGSFKDPKIEDLYNKFPMSKDWHFHISLPLKGKMTRPEFIQRLQLGVLLGFL